MPVHFAAARCTARSPIARALAKRALSRAANDNGDGAVATSFDTMMRAALRHFAQHGMGAAEAARRQAEQAHFVGDEQARVWWLGICRTLDHRLAARLERAFRGGPALIH